MTPQEILENITNKIQGDGTNYTAQDDEALAFIQKAIEKQIPKRPKNIKISPNSDPFIRKNERTGICPMCGAASISSEHHCICGQALDWGEGE